MAQPKAKKKTNNHTTNKSCSNNEQERNKEDTTEKNVTEAECDSPLTNVNGNGQDGQDESDPMKRNSNQDDRITKEEKIDKEGTKEEEEEDNDRSADKNDGVVDEVDVSDDEGLGKSMDSKISNSKSNEDVGVGVLDVDENDKQSKGKSTKEAEKAEAGATTTKTAHGAERISIVDDDQQNKGQANKENESAGDSKNDEKVNNDDENDTMDEKVTVQTGTAPTTFEVADTPRKKKHVDYDTLYPPDDILLAPSDRPIVTPKESDILFGRGGLTNHHPGNKYFRQLVADHKGDYVHAPKVVKPRVARKLVKMIRNGNPPGRFLKKSDGFWFDVGDRHASEKTSQALREKSQEEKRESRKRHEAATLKENLTPNDENSKVDSKGVDENNSTNGMNDTSCASKSVPPIIPPPYSGFVVAPYAYYPMHSYSPGYPPPPPPYHGMHPYAVPPMSAGKSEEGKEGLNNDTSPNPEKKGQEEMSRSEVSKTPNPGQSIQSIEALISATSSQPTNYPLEGGIFGEADDSGNIIVTERDILCGRGGATNHHKGNKRFRDIVALHRQDYVNAPKIKKPLVAKLIVKAIRSSDPPGRFLKKNDDGKWFDIGDKKAAEKSSQALREKQTTERIPVPGEMVEPVPMYLSGFPHGAHPHPMGYYAYPIMSGQPFSPSLGEMKTPPMSLAPGSTPSTFESPSKDDVKEITSKQKQGDDINIDNINKEEEGDRKSDEGSDDKVDEPSAKKIKIEDTPDSKEMEVAVV